MDYSVNDIIRLTNSHIKLGLILSINNKDKQLSVFNADSHTIDTLSSESYYMRTTNRWSEKFVKREYQKYMYKQKIDSYMPTHVIDKEIYLKSISEIFNCTELNSSEITRILTCLEGNLRLNTFLDLVCYTPFDLIRVRNIGKKTYQDIVSVVLKYCELTGIESIFTEEEYMSVL